MSPRRARGAVCAGGLPGHPRAAGEDLSPHARRMCWLCGLTRSCAACQQPGQPRPCGSPPPQLLYSPARRTPPRLGAGNLRPSSADRAHGGRTHKHAGPCADPRAAGSWPATPERRHQEHERDSSGGRFLGEQLEAPPDAPTPRSTVSSRLRAWHVDATSFRNRYRALQQEHRAQQHALAHLSDRLGDATAQQQSARRKSRARMLNGASANKSGCMPASLSTAEGCGM